MKNDYGVLITPQIKLHRKYFIEMAKLLGVKFQFRAPREDKEFDTHGDLDTDYFPPMEVYGIFEDHPDQKTLKKMGWVAELQESSSMIHVPYDLEGLEVGALFTLPSGIDGAPGRLFRVISMQNIMIYPASISCEVAPEYFDTTPKNETYDLSLNTQIKLVDLEDDD